MRTLSALFVMLSTVGCINEFDPYNETIGFRILAMRADRPTLRPGERTVVDALIHPPADNAPVSYSWSWCPFRGSPESKFDCAVSEAELQAQIDAAVGPGVVTVPPYTLSSTATATYGYDLPPQLFSGLCTALQEMSLPLFVTAPDCDGTFEITIRLVANGGGKEIIAVKELSLVYRSDAPINTNPRLGEVRYRDLAKDPVEGIVLEPGNAPTLTREVDYELSLEIDEENAEMIPVATATSAEAGLSREILFVTWFIEGGETESQRTSFIDGEVDFDVLRKNELTTPRKPDYPAANLRMYFVLRDTRGGVDFTIRDIVLAEPQ